MLKVMTVRIDEKILRMAKTKSKEEGRGISEVIRHLLSQYVGKNNDGKK